MSEFELEKIYLAIKDSNEEIRQEIRKSGLLIASAILNTSQSCQSTEYLDRDVANANNLLDRIDEENA